MARALLGGAAPAGGLDSATARLVLVDIRLARAVLAFAAGAGLAASGAVFQGVLRNPLADPFTLGVSGGAAFGGALAISLGLTGLAWGAGLPLAAFGGAALALFAVLFLARLGGGLRRETLILAGVVVSAFLAALIALVKALDEPSVSGIVFWIMGSLQGRTWREAGLALPGILLGLLVVMPHGRALDLLSLGGRQAASLGLRARQARLRLLLAAGLITASCVAVCGIIGFVGLIVPHLCRLLVGGRHGRLLWAVLPAGGLLLLWADVLARAVLPGGVELPVAVLTALLGGPFFCFLLVRRGGAGHRAAGASDAARPPVPWEAPLEQPAQTAAHVAVRGLFFRYAGMPANALEGIRLELPQGSFTGLLGPNGSGKSTLLQCIAGALAPCRGEALLHGKPAHGWSPGERARNLALLPQRAEIPAGLTALEVVLMGRYAHTGFFSGYSPKDKETALRSLEAAGALAFARRPAEALSGGERQRVFLARALAQATPLLLLDEATAGLDPAFQVQILSTLRRRNEEQGVTVLAAMHDLNLAALYCRHLVLLKRGRVVARGTVEEVFTQGVLEAVYDTPVRVVAHPATGLPQVLAEPGGPQERT